MEISTKPSKATSKSLWRKLRAVYYMLYKGIAKHKFTTNINFRLFLEQSKTIAFSSSKYVDRSNSFSMHREVEFSCSNTPCQFLKQKKSSRYHHYYASTSKAFDEFINNGSPLHHVRQLRITDSPFLSKEEEGEMGEHVDQEAEDFIFRFYQELRSQEEF